MNRVEFKTMFRRIVQEEARQELRKLQEDPRAILYDWRYERSEDLEGDENLARRTLALSRRPRESPGEQPSLEDLQNELKLAEAVFLGSGIGGRELG